MPLEKFHEKAASFGRLILIEMLVRCYFLRKICNVLSLPKPHTGKQIIFSNELVEGPGAHVSGDQNY